MTYLASSVTAVAVALAGCTCRMALTAFLFSATFLTALFGAEAQVVIKQYIEGTGFNKAIQLDNLAADAAVCLLALDTR